jgi:hypothetical protein
VLEHADRRDLVEAAFAGHVAVILQPHLAAVLQPGGADALVRERVLVLG